MDPHEKITKKKLNKNCDSQQILPVLVVVNKNEKGLQRNKSQGSGEMR